MESMDLRQDHARTDELAPDDRSLLAAIVGDGCPLLTFTSICLTLAGRFAHFPSAVD